MSRSEDEALRRHPVENVIFLTVNTTEDVIRSDHRSVLRSVNANWRLIVVPLINPAILSNQLQSRDTASGNEHASSLSKTITAYDGEEILQLCQNADLMCVALSAQTEAMLPVLEKLNIPIILLTPYNYSTAQTVTLPAQTYPDHVKILETGFGKNQAGILFAPIQPAERPLETIIKEDLALGTLLLGDANAALYVARCVLYFGQATHLNIDPARNTVDVAAFVACAVQDGLAQGKNQIDIIVSLTEAPNLRCSLQEIQDVLREAGLLEEINLTVYSKDQDEHFSEMVEVEVYANRPTIRLIDYEPIRAGTIARLQQVSQPLSMAASLRFISFLWQSPGKIPLLQVTTIQQPFYDALLKVIASAENLGEDSALYQFLQMQQVYTDHEWKCGTCCCIIPRMRRVPVEVKVTWRDLYNFYDAHQSELTADMETFAQYIIDHENLYENLTDMIEVCCDADASLAMASAMSSTSC